MPVVSVGPGRAPAGAAGGLSLVEVIVAAALLATLLLGFLGAWSGAASQRTVAEERRAAREALAAFIEARRAEPLATVLTTGAVPASPTASAGGATRAVLAGATGRFVRFNDEGPATTAPRAAGQRVFSSASLPTTSDAAAVGLPLDLNGDGDTTDSAVPASELILLPARVSITWRSALGGEELEEALYVVFSDH